MFNSKLFGFLFCDAREPGYFDPAIRGELAAYAQILAAIIAVEFFSIQTLSGALTTAREFSRYRDEETANHLHRMSAYSRLIARAVATRYPLNDEEVEFIYLFSELHDIGKIAVPDAILLKPGKLTPEEYGVMKIHPLKGREMIALMISEFGLDGIHHTDMLKNIIAYHHERFDGQGYPEGLAGRRSRWRHASSRWPTCSMHSPASGPTSRPGRSKRPLPTSKPTPAASSTPPASPRRCATRRRFAPSISNTESPPPARLRAWCHGLRCLVLPCCDSARDSVRAAAGFAPSRPSMGWSPS